MCRALSGSSCIKGLVFNFFGRLLCHVLSNGAGVGALTAGVATGVIVMLACGGEPAESEPPPPPPPQATKITAREARGTERIVASGVILQTSIKNEKKVSAQGSD